MTFPMNGALEFLAHVRGVIGWLQRTWTLAQWLGSSSSKQLIGSWESEHTSHVNVKHVDVPFSFLFFPILSMGHEYIQNESKPKLIARKFGRSQNIYCFNLKAAWAIKIDQWQTDCQENFIKVICNDNANTIW